MLTFRPHTVGPPQGFPNITEPSEVEVVLIPGEGRTVPSNSAQPCPHSLGKSPRGEGPPAASYIEQAEKGGHSEQQSRPSQPQEWGSKGKVGGGQHKETKRKCF